MRLSGDDGGAGRALHTWIGALLLALGAGAAILAIPEDVTAKGALTPSAFILAMAVLAPTLPSLRNDVRSLLRGENMLLGALIYWTLAEVLQGGYSAALAREAVVREYALIATAALGFWLGATLGRRPLMPRFVLKEALDPWSRAGMFALLTVAFTLGIWDFLYRSNFDLDVVLSSLLQDRWSTPWQREALGDWSAFSYHLQYFGYLVPPMAVLLALRAGWRDPRSWIGLLMSLSILTFHAQGGGRRIVGSMILAGLFCWLIHVRTFTVRRAAVTAAAVAALVAVLQLMLIYRGMGIGDEADALPEFDYVFVDDNFRSIGQMLEFVPSLHPFVGSQYVVYALVRPVPRVLWPEKPVDGGFDLAELLGIPDTSFALTAPGELYVSLGYLTVLLGTLVYGRLATMVNGLFAYPPALVNPLFPSLMLVWLFVGVRSMLEIMLMGYVLLAVMALSKTARFVGNLRPGGSATQDVARGG